MTAVLYKTLDGHEVTINQLEDACGAACSTLAGALLILRVFAENGDEDTTDLCNALTVMLLHVDNNIDNIRPHMPPMIDKRASLPDVATAHTGG